MKYASIIAIIVAVTVAWGTSSGHLERVRIASTSDNGFAWHVPDGYRLALESAVRIDRGGNSWVVILVDDREYARVKLRNGYADLSGMYVRGGRVQVVQRPGKNQHYAIYGRLEVR